MRAMAPIDDRRLTDSGIEVKPVYTAEDVAGGELEPPGRVSVSAARTTMYRGRPWTMRQYAGFGSAEETNARFRYLLERGQTGLSVAFDLPTQLGYDSDDPLAEGEVGRTGVAIDSLADMEALLDGIPLDQRVDVDDDQRARGAAARCCTSSSREEQGVPAAKLRGTVQNDILKEYVARGNYIFPPRAVDATCDRPLRLLRGARCQGSTRSRSRGYHIREAGATAAQELAFTLANGIAYFEAAVGAGLDVGRRSRRACRSFSTRTTTSSRRSRSSALRAGCGPRSCATASVRRTQARWRCASTRRRAARRSRRSSRRTTSCASPSRRCPRSSGGAQSLHTNSLRRGARAADRASRDASRCARSRSSRTRPARPTRPTRSAARTSSRR